MIIADTNKDPLVPNADTIGVTVTNGLGYEVEVDAIACSFPPDAKYALLTKVTLGENTSESLTSGQVTLGTIGAEAGTQVRLFPLKRAVRVPANQKLIFHIKTRPDMAETIKAGTLCFAMPTRMRA